MQTIIKHCLPLLLLLPFSIGAAAATVKPNVLLICVDDLKPVIHCYGDATAKTPHFDRLAARGVRFDSAYCNQAVCSPSRNALMTSLRPQSLGIYDLATNFRKSAPDAITMPQYFRNHGYHAEALGKIYHVGHGNVDDAASWDVPLFKAAKPSYVLAGAEKRIDSQGNERGPATESADVDDEAYADGAVATEAIKRLNAAAKNNQTPFFLAVGFIRPHLPFVAPKKYWDLYDPTQLPMPQITNAPRLAPSYAPTGFGELRNYTGIPQSGAIDAELTRQLIHGYYAAASYTDAQVGRLLDALDASSVADNTIIVLWGDHGWHLGDHGMWCKHTNYEQATRIPVIVSAPGQAQGVATNSMIESVDIYPTLSELAGLEKPIDIEGVSFANVLKEPASPARSSVIHVYPRGERLGRAIRTPRYRMVQWKSLGTTTEEAEYELYDYVTDPLETENIAAARPDILQELQAILATHPEPKPQWKANAAAKSNSKPTSDRAAMFKQRDKDANNELTFDEFMSKQPDAESAKLRFPKFDKNNDGVLSPSEFIGQ